MADDSAKSADRAELPKDVLAPAEGPRENLVATAVKFLQNPKVRHSPLSQKKAFLESKGLTSDEIQLAVQRSGVTDDVSSSQTAQPPQPVPQHPGAYGQSALVPVQPMLPPPVPISPWTKAREFATTAAIVAAVSYAVYNVFKTYIRPWLMGKSEAETRLERLENSITELQAAVTESNAQMVETLKAVQESLTLQRDRTVQSTEVSVRQETHALNEIKSEVSSLKALLLSRRQFPPPPTTSPIIPAWQKSSSREETPLSAQLKSGASSAGDGADQTEVNTAPAEDSTPEDKLQGMAQETVLPSTQSSENDVQVSQSGSGDMSVSQSASSNNGFELVKPASESDPAAEVD